MTANKEQERADFEAWANGYYRDDPRIAKRVIRHEYQDMLAAAPQPPEAAQPQRAPLDAYKLREIIKRLNADHDEEGWNFGDLARAVEAYHGITQEKQG